MESKASAAASVKPKNSKKKADIPALQFSELDDLFLAQKGKKLRNLQKKFDKMTDQEKLVKKGEITPNEDMLAKLSTKPALKAEIKELKDLCDLYMKSNPDFDKKTKKAEITQQDIDKAVAASLKQVSQVLTLTALLKDDASLVEASDEQLASLNALATSVSAVPFEQTTDSDLVSRFQSLADKSEDLVCEGGVSYADLSSLLSAQFSESIQKSQTIQRIANKSTDASKADAEDEQTKTPEEGDGVEGAGKPAGDDEQDKTPDVDEKDTTPADDKTAEKADDSETKIFSGEESREQRGRGGRGRGRGGDRGDRRGGRGDRRGGRGGQRKDPDDDWSEETGQRKSNRGRGGRGRRDNRGRGRGGDRGGRPQTASGEQQVDVPTSAAAATPGQE